MGVTKLAQETGMTLEEAKKFRNTYLDRMPGVKAFREKQRKQLNSLGYTETMGIEYAPGKHTLGRRRYITKVFMTEEDIPHLIGKTEPSPFQRNKKVSSVTQERKKSKSAAEREAGNHPVQGTNADICKLAMILCQRKLKKKNMQSSLCLQVHDELVFDAHPDEVEDLIEIIVETMSTIVNLEVPLVCDARAADNWADAH
jgi:DNA polymerase-1